MTRNIFISFRYADGIKYKEHLQRLFDMSDNFCDFSEDEDRSNLNEDSIKRYLYSKLKKTSLTIVIITPMALNYREDRYGRIDDWMYDEVRYSLEDRENNRSNALIALYVPEVEHRLISKGVDGNIIKVNNFNNLCLKNMFNVLPEHKMCSTRDSYNRDYDSYCSLVPFDDFVRNPKKYIQIAEYKRDNINNYKLIKSIQNMSWIF
ncbi:MAG: TIR domain-containing protein [Bacilli bacterium]|nr:TIR domain-containing protein [Bacilli bacterium]